MSTRIEIANLALSFISGNEITSFEDDSNEAKLCKRHYAPARDATLEAQDWTFARKRFIPAQDASAPLFGWGKAFTVPNDILRVISCDLIDTPGSQLGTMSRPYQPDQIDWQLEDRKILTNEDVVYARGTRRVDDEGKFSPLFVHALAAKMAVLMALPLTQSRGVMQDAAALYSTFIEEAKSRDASQGRTRRMRQQSLDRAR